MNVLDILSELRIGDNPLWRIGVFFLCLVAALAGGRYARQQLLAAAAQRRAQGRPVWPTVLEAFGRAVGFGSLVVGLAIGFRVLSLPDQLAAPVHTALSVLSVLAIGYALYCFADVPYVLLSRRAAATESRFDDMLLTMVRKSLRITIVVLTLVQAAQMLSDKPLTSLIAGLGVGSLAVALAGQDSIKNFFGSLVILADKPFELGQRILVDGHDGVVESVGMRSTRIRTLDGNLVTFPNGELANKVIVNISRRPYIRRVMNVTIPYDTPPEKVRRAVEIVKALLENHEGMDPSRPPRVFFNEFNPTSLNIQAIYWYHPPDHFAYMSFSERLNMELLRRFNEEGIEFAFPTQTVFVAQDPRRSAAAPFSPSPPVS